MGEDRSEESLVAHHVRKSGAAIESELQAQAGGQGAPVFDESLQKGVEARRAWEKRNGAGVEAGERKQVVDQVGQASALAIHRLQVTAKDRKSTRLNSS